MYSQSFVKKLYIYIPKFHVFSFTTIQIKTIIINLFLVGSFFLYAQRSYDVSLIVNNGLEFQLNL